MRRVEWHEPGMGKAALTSVGLHVGVLLTLLAGTLVLPRSASHQAATDGPQIEMIQQADVTGDSDQVTVPTAAIPLVDPQPATPPPTAPAPNQQVPMPLGGMPIPMPASVPMPSGPPQPNQAQPPAPTPSDALDQAIGAAVASGAGVIPPSPDARHNIPPRYPEDAKRHNEEGRVLLVVHVAPDGHVLAVDVERPAHSAALTRAAQDAVLHWHFHPGRAGDTPIEATFETEIVFKLVDKKIIPAGVFHDSH